MDRAEAGVEVGLGDGARDSVDPFRRCDFLASKLSDLEGGPRCELSWPEGRRDGVVVASAAVYFQVGGDD